MNEIIKAGKDQVVMTKYGFDFLVILFFVTFNIPDILVFVYIGSKKRKKLYDSSIKYLCKHKQVINNRKILVK